MDEPKKTVLSVKCENVRELIEALTKGCEEDPRGADIGMLVGVNIETKYVRTTLFEYEDRTRETGGIVP